MPVVTTIVLDMDLVGWEVANSIFFPSSYLKVNNRKCLIKERKKWPAGINSYYSVIRRPHS